MINIIATLDHRPLLLFNFVYGYELFMQKNCIFPWCFGCKGKTQNLLHNGAHNTKKNANCRNPFIILLLNVYSNLRLLVRYFAKLPSKKSNRVIMIFKIQTGLRFYSWSLFFHFDIFRYSSIYSWSISHILEHEFFCFGRLGSSG